MSQASGTHIVYAPHPDTSDDSELNALVAVYRFLFFEKCKEGGCGTAPDDEKARSRNDSLARFIVPE